jgi:hypothetical protein
LLLCCFHLLQGCLRLKGENGIMRKKFQALQKDIEEQREQLSLQHEQQKELYTTIKGRWLTGLLSLQKPILFIVARLL